MAPGEILRDLSIEDRSIIEQGVAAATAAWRGVCDRLCHSAAEKLPEGNAGGKSSFMCSILQIWRQDHRGPKHNYVYIIA